MAAELTLVQLAPLSVLLKIPLPNVPEQSALKIKLTYKLALLFGSGAIASTLPRSIPLVTWLNEVPEFVDRNTPMLSQLKESAVSTVATIVVPRAATPEIFLLAIPPSSTVQLAPPSVVRYKPVRDAPKLPKLLNRPTPATRV